MNAINITYSLDDIFEIAQQIERNGAVFYRKAAIILNTNALVSNLFLTLLAQEKEHELMFRKMREALVKNVTAKPRQDKSDIIGHYLRELAGQFVFDLENNPLENSLHDDLSVEQALRLALGMEKDSIVFYTGLRQAVDAEAQQKVDCIIKQEELHFSGIAKTIRELRAGRK